MNFQRIKEMKKTMKILVIISVALIIFLSFSIYRQTITGQAVGDYYTYTKAICNESNYCQDYEIVCEGNEIIKTNPITGASVQNPENWQDPRPESEQNRDGLCNFSE